MSLDSVAVPGSRSHPPGEALAGDVGATNAVQDAWFKILHPMLTPDRPAQAPGSGAYEQVNVTVDGQKRQYEVYRPAGFDPAKPARVIMGFHGSIFGQDAASGLMARETGLDQAIDKRSDSDNTLLVYPIANNRTASMITGQSWNYANHKNMFDTWKNYDDGQYMDRVLDQLKQHVGIKEIDGIGFGDGGRFLKQYSDEHPGLFRKVVLDNATTFGDTPTSRILGVNTDYLIMHAIRDPAKSSFIDRVLHPFTTNLMLPYDGGSGILADITPNASGLSDSHPNMLKVEASRQTGALPPVVIDTAKETDTLYASSGGGSVTERLEKGAQMAWNDIHNGDGGHGIFALFGARSDFDDTKDSLDFILDGKTKFTSTDTDHT